jgi:RNA polymerase sigma factor (TIGR02999 family)
LGWIAQPTALVHEAWIRLAGKESRTWDGRAHFFGAAAEAMRRILIDNARRKSASCHGAGHERLNIQEIKVAAPDADEQLLAIHEALDQLVTEDPPKAELVKLRYFVGMTLEEDAEVLRISEATAKRWWAYARAWLYCEIKQRM